MHIIDIKQIKGDLTFNKQISYVQPICNIRKISEYMQASSR